MRILLVDDHLLFQESLGRMLDSQPDMTVVGGATSVNEAVVKGRELKPDVILMDFTLSDGTGLEVTRAILSEQPAIKVIFLTVREEDEVVFNAVREGAQGFLPKDIATACLLDYLRGLQRGEIAIPPRFTARILKEFAKLPPTENLDSEATSRLTMRQREILQELKTGATNRQIAARLVISEQTVKNHVSLVLKKLNLKSRHGLVKSPFQAGNYSS
jgi:DNA-binding NarL/FixJ family response regulator